MNNSCMMSHTSPAEWELVERALSALNTSLPVRGKVSIKEIQGRDALIRLDIAGRKLKYECEVKQRIDRRAVLLDLQARGLATPGTLLVTSVLSHDLAMTCREIGLQFIDAAGNAYLDDGAGLLVYISGQRLQHKNSNTLEGVTITPAALRVIFAFLTEPSMLNASYREIAAAVRVSTGAIGKVFDTLEARGFIATDQSGRRVIAAPDLLLGEWAAGYLSRLRPKLKAYRFGGLGAKEFSERWQPGIRRSAWGGEVAAAIHTRHLTPETCTVYVNMDDPDTVREMVRSTRLQADPSGSIEVVESFWNMDWFTNTFPTVPLHLIYADLLGSHDSRNLAAAGKIAVEVVHRVRH